MASDSQTVAVDSAQCISTVSASGTAEAGPSLGSYTSVVLLPAHVDQPTAQSSYETGAVPVGSYNSSRSTVTSTIAGVGPIKTIFQNHVELNHSQNVLKYVPHPEGQLAPATRTPQQWVLIEWTMPAGEPNAYSVIPVSEIVQMTGASVELTTGKSVLVKRGRHMLPATIVMISDEKRFLDTELNQLRKMCTADNATHLPHPESYPASQQRRYLPGGQQCPEASPVPTMPAVTMEYDYAEFDGVVPPTSVRTIVPRIERSGARRAEIRPMTFDQQTQTIACGSSIDVAVEAHLKRISSYLESIMAEQKSYRMESEYQRKLLHELHEKASEHDAKLEAIRRDARATDRLEEDTHKSLSSDVNCTATEETYGYRSASAESERSKHVVTSTNGGLLLQTVADGHVEGSRTTNETTGILYEWSRPARVNSPESEASVENKQHRGKAPQTRSDSVRSMIETDWSDTSGCVAGNDDLGAPSEDGDRMVVPVEYVSIGRNNTMVKRRVLDNIKWSNYKSATRSLLMELFSRHDLATRSLSGRPSPAFAGDGRKPVKHKLDPDVIADVIEIVSSSCKVATNMVRTAITTKCADENKMLRQRQATAAKAANNGSSSPSEISDRPKVTAKRRKMVAETRRSPGVEGCKVEENKENLG
ncbi:uncharacterized protein LOC131208233 [Anopheles bellator]|uniref:uncharacterized protein LOC131208233 n=1 Tax=Anopheles bellator TaxID=139047 RepID=UPI002648C832|nr:uncharacterized protein LOC131208233 [Anopheles bellator]